MALSRQSPLPERLLIFGSSAAAYMHGDLDLLPALLVPWAGFYWAKLFCWRGVVD